MRLENKYLAIQSLNRDRNYPIVTLCDILELNRSSYYKWLRRDQSAQEAKDKDLIDKICFLYQESNGILGYRRMQISLRRRFGVRCNKKRVYRVMRAVGLKSVIRRKRPNYRKSKPEMTAENILKRDFVAKNLNEKWLTDVTEFRYGSGGRLYLSAIIDLKDKSVVSYTIGRKNNLAFILDTFNAAIEKYPNAKPLFHSDRGTQYTSRVFGIKLESQGMIHSMSRVGRCIDNGPMEAFWGTLKTEMYYLQKFSNYDGLKKAIDKYIAFYNNHRYQERLGGLTPLEYRASLESA